MRTIVLLTCSNIFTICVFAAFATSYMKQPLTRDFLWASLCLVAAAYFMFRGNLPMAR